MKVFNSGVLFKGDDNIDQLRKIAQFIGAADIIKYIQRYQLKPDPKVR
jgi:hypothetical protein